MPLFRPYDPAVHAQDFSERHRDLLDYFAAQTMFDLGIPASKIGAGDPEHGIRHSAFHAHGQNGGDVSPDGRIVIDSGVMNPALLTPIYGEAAGKLWARSRLRSRMEAIVAHEHAEHTTGNHEEALAMAPDTELPISHAAREILKAMKQGQEP